MKYKQLISGAFLLWTCIACSGKKEQAATVAEATSSPWDNYYIGKIDFKNLSPEAKGSAIYAAVIPDPEAYITKHGHRGDPLYIKGIRRGIRERRSAPFHQYRIQHEMDREKFCQ